MTLADIIALAKQGYKPNDIKDLLALAESMPEAAQPEQAPAPAEEPAQPEPELQKTLEPDYKKMYEESQASLRKAQEAATRRTVPEIQKPSDDDTIADVVRSFM